MLDIEYTSQFKKDVRRLKKQGKDLRRLDEILFLLRKQEALPVRNKDHALVGSYEGYRECHVSPNWLLIYKSDNKKLVLTATRTGSHSDLF